MQVEGDPQHASGAFCAGSNAIEKAYLLIAALKELEIVWNARKVEHPHFCNHPHPIRFNLGKIAGGDWTSSVPAWCHFDMRVAIYPGEDLAAACAEIEACIAAAARADNFLANRPPKVVYNGFMAEGYVLENADDLEAALRRSHEAAWGAPLQEHVTSATTDARFFGLYGETPAIVYGPICRMPHGYDEAVDLNSVRRVTQTLALFIADWCGRRADRARGGGMSDSRDCRHRRGSRRGCAGRSASPRRRRSCAVTTDWRRMSVPLPSERDHNFLVQASGRRARLS